MLLQLPWTTPETKNVRFDIDLLTKLLPFFFFFILVVLQRIHPFPNLLAMFPGDSLLVFLETVIRVH